MPQKIPDLKRMRVPGAVKCHTTKSLAQRKPSPRNPPKRNPQSHPRPPPPPPTPTPPPPPPPQTPKPRGAGRPPPFLAHALHLELTIAKPWGDSRRYDFIIDN